MRDQITRQELQTSFKALELDSDTIEKITAMVGTVQGLEITEEVKLCKALTTDDMGKEVSLNDRQIEGLMHDFHEDEHGNFYMSIDFKMHRFKADSIIVLKKTFKGAETLISEG